MSKSIREVTLLELVPENFRSDPDIIAASKAVDREFRVLVKAIKNCLTFADIDQASSEVVDLLAAEMNVDFYDQNYTLEKRRRLVKNAYLYKYTKGTAFAVKAIVAEAFDNASIREWHEYGGQPYWFRIVFAGSIPDTAKLNEVIDAIKRIKNIRSHLAPTIASSSIETPHFFGGIIRQTNYQQIGG